MKIGLFFGSFNPVHHGHLIIANHIAYNYHFDEVWLVVSPQNPFKAVSSLLNQNHRLYFIEAAIEGERKLKASNIEFQLPKPSYTIDTLAYLEEKYPNHEFTIIIGSDSFQNIKRWKNAEIILRKYKFIIYKRPGFEIEQEQHENISIADAPFLEISSTHIRKLIQEGKSIKFLVPEKVREEIEKYGYYKTAKEK
jgi:nicotinate-nucleotide adenylyltransferase